MKDDRHPRILISRLSHIGDCILAVPMLNALREHYPQALIAWAVERPSVPLLQGHPALDELIVLGRGWLKSPGAVWQLRRRLRKFRFDTTIDPQCLTKSAVVGWLAGAPVRIGFAGDDGRELSRWLNNRLVRRTEQHMVDRGLELLRPLGIERPEIQYRLPIGPAAEATADELARREELRQGFVVINPGAGWQSRLWPPDRYGQVASHLWKEHRLRSIVAWYGQDERLMADQIVAASDGSALAAPPTDLLSLAAVLKRAQIYVGSDTGPLHLAVAVGTRCVSLHGPTRASQSGPHGPGHRALQEVYLEGTSRQRRKADNATMKAIPVEAVAKACSELVAEIQVAPDARRAA
ncbi:MAG: glycosyltransferase family 9 protein [Thermoguttaceae bacterium]